MLCSRPVGQALYMKIFGEELGSRGRWYIALLPALLIAFLIGLFLVAVAGQTQLNTANRRIHDSQLRQQVLGEFVALVTDAESAQRGYLLTGEGSYLDQYSAAIAMVDSALNRVHGAYESENNSAEFQQLRLLTGKKLGELEETVRLFKKRGPKLAVNAVGTEVSQRTTDQIIGIANALRADETAESAAADAQWQRQYSMSRWATLSGALIAIGIVLLASRLVLGDMRRRAAHATGLRDQKIELERQVDDRTRELTALSTHLQGVSEQEKSALSRELHDELGGLLVAARMDLSWLQNRLQISDPAVETRFRRIHESLSAGVDLKRRVVEELRPTLLDNMGLFAAIRWQYKESCRRTNLDCTESIPEEELPFSPEAAIGVFRVVQEALVNIVKHAEASKVDLIVDYRNDALFIEITDDGKGIPPERLEVITTHGLASMRHRVAGLGGTWIARPGERGGTVVRATFPLSRAMGDVSLAKSA